MLVISNRPRASCSSDFEITRAITPWIVLHTVQLLLLIIIIIIIIITIIKGSPQGSKKIWPRWVCIGNIAYIWRPNILKKKISFLISRWLCGSHTIYLTRECMRSILISSFRFRTFKITMSQRFTKIHFGGCFLKTTMWRKKSPFSYKISVYVCMGPKLKSKTTKTKLIVK